MKKLFFFLVLTISVSVLWAQVGNNSFNTSSWKLLDNAQRAYDEGDIMMAMKLAENARQARIEEFTNAADTMEKALIPTAVQRRGDVIANVRAIWEERKETQAIAVLDDALLLHTVDDFGNNINNVCEWYRSRVAYPEAEYLLAKVYMLEGEYDLAAVFFDNALSHANVLDIPEEKISILYDFAYLDELRENTADYEKKLTDIIDYNQSKKTIQEQNEFNTYLSAIIRATGNNRSIDNFFLLYRMNDYDTISACIELASYYVENDYYAKAYPFSIRAVLTSFTKIYEILTSRNVKYAFKSDPTGNDRIYAFTGFIKEALKYSDVQKWMRDNKVWNSFYIFGKLLLEYRHNTPLANDVFTVLYNECPDSYVKKAAATMLGINEEPDL